MPMDLHDLLSKMALEISDSSTTLQSMDTIAQYARTAVNGDEAGIMVVQSRHRVETPAATGDVVDRMHQLQAELDEGPCLEAVRDGEHSHLVSDAFGDPRWPRWGRAIAELGYRSVVSSSLETRSHRYGSLNVYAERTNAFDSDDLDIVKTLATHASVGMAAVKERGELHQALSTRTLIGQAEGVLMHAFNITAEQAFAYLRRISQERNMKLVKVATAVIETGPMLRPPEREPEPPDDQPTVEPEPPDEEPTAEPEPAT